MWGGPAHLPDLGKPGLGARRGPRGRPTFAWERMERH